MEATHTATLSVRLVSPAEMEVEGPEDLHTWREAQRMPWPGFEYMPRYKRGEWDGTYVPGRWCVQRGDRFVMRCARGLYGRLSEAFGALDGLTADVKWLELAKRYAEQHPRWTELRDYQQDAFFRCVAAGWGRIGFATNAGKGAVMALLADFMARHGVRVLIACDELAVFDALQGELREWGGLTPFMVGQGVTAIPLQLERARVSVTLAMVPTLARRISSKHSREDDAKEWRQWLGGVGVVLCDEADKATADTWQSVLRAAKGSYWRLGFSGTFPAAYTFDDWRLEECLGPILASKRNAEMVERGISARPTVTLAMHDVTPTLHPLPRASEWFGMRGAEKRQWVYERAVLYNQSRHALVASLIRPGVATAVVINRVEHGELLREYLGRDRAVFLDGSDNEQYRFTTLEAFRKGKFPVLIVTKILDRGTNRLGFARDVIFASSEGSTRQTLQRIGRGLRRADGKAELRIVDIIDRVTVDPEADDFPSRQLQVAGGFLARAGKARVTLYEAEGFQVEVQR